MTLYIVDWVSNFISPDTRMLYGSVIREEERVQTFTQDKTLIIR